MQMNQQEQKWLVLLYSLIELDGGSQRKNILRHIQENGYWDKNDQNDVPHPTRKEKAWRNDFSFERQHLVDRGYMQAGVKGIWKITEAGREYVDSLAERLILTNVKIFQFPHSTCHTIRQHALCGKENLIVSEYDNIPFDDTARFTANFYHKFFQAQMHPEFTADNILLEQLSQAEETQDESAAILSDEPAPKGPVSQRSGNRRIYLRDPSVARRALARAEHRCEVDEEHISFMRRNGRHLYMEPHHLIPMSMTDSFDVSLDREQNIFSLCSNCHNQIHYGAKEDVRRIITKLFLSREQEICSILGRNITLEEIYQIYNVQ